MSEVLPPKPRTRDVLRWLGISDVTLWRWRQAGTFPKPVKLGNTRTLFWDRDELLAWYDRRRAAEDCGSAS
jgi:predicted DNA-binding transcriptional regulator AlpA